ncbi:MAG: hypothetical protein IJW62_02475 [Clostridia bacterium]|nr:hypothetical protein [Clostridia bacterium]
MKKRISLLLSALLALSVLTVGMTSCDEELPAGNAGDDSTVTTTDDPTKLNGKTPEKAYNDALAAINSVSNCEMISTQDINMKMNYNGEAMEQKQKQTITQKMDGDNVYAKIGGGALEQETWYVDGVLYTISGDVKAKATLSLKEYQEQMMGDSSDNLLHIPEAWFKDVQFKTVDGQKTLEFKIDGKEYLNLVDNALDSMGTSVDDMVISEVLYTVYFTADGSIEKVVNVFSTTFSLQGIEVEASYNTVTTVSIGTAGKITAPADGDSFIDVTDNMDSIG